MAVAELAAAARLLLVARVRPRLAANRLAVRHARRVQLDVDAEAALRALEGYLDVHLTHAREDLLARLLVAAQVQRLILLCETPDRGCDLLLVALRLRGDREAHDRLREPEVRHLDLDFLVDEQVARLRLLELGHRADVALAEVERGLVLLPLQLEERAEPLFPLPRRLTSVVSAVIVPLRTRKRLMRPANGSATVLKTKIAAEAPSTSIGEPFFAGDGTPSTRRSRSACVPRFLVATPHATGNTSPLVTAALRAAATSCASSSWPSR